MKVTGDAKIYYIQETEKARLDMIKAIGERDKVNSDVSQQRSALNEISDLVKKEQKKLDDLRLNSKDFNNHYDKNKSSFSEKRKKQKEAHEKVLDKIKESEKELKILEKEKDKYIKISNKVKVKEKDFNKINSDYLENIRNNEKLKKENISLQERITKNAQTFNEKKEDLNNKENYLNKRERALNKKEDRLKDLKEEIFSKKNNS